MKRSVASNDWLPSTCAASMIAAVPLALSLAPGLPTES